MRNLKISAFILLVFLGLQTTQAQQLELYSQPKKVNSLVMLKSNEVFINLAQTINWNSVTFQCESATITKQKKRGYFSIVPKSEDIDIAVYTNGKSLGTINLEAFRPYIQARTASVTALYYNCGNQLFINPEGYDIDLNKLNFKVVGAELIEHDQPGLVTIIPKSPSVSLEVFEGNQKLETLEYRVRNIPHPAVQIRAGNQPIDLKSGMGLASFNSNLSVLIQPDEDFKSFLPKDTRYSAEKYTVTLASGIRAVKSITASTGKSINITPLLLEAKPGDRLIVEVKDISRKNFQDQVEPVQLHGTTLFVIPLN